MVSILTNTSAISALQTLRSIGWSLEDTQSKVSTGLRVGAASDNAAYWSIATTMRSDNGALAAVQDALGLGAATVDTAYAGMSATVDVIAEIKSKLIVAAEPGVDRTKVQEEIKQLQDQLRSIASSSSFSGQNWLVGKPDPVTWKSLRPVSDLDGPLLDGSKTVVASFTRDAEGNVAVRTIDVNRTTQDVVFAPSVFPNGITRTGLGIADSPISYESKSFRDGDGYTRPIAILDYQSSWERKHDDLYFNGTDYITRYEGMFFKAEGDSGKIDLTNTISLNENYMPEITVESLDITKLDFYTDVLMGTEAPDEFGLDALISFVDSRLQRAINTTAKYGALSNRIELQEDFASRLTDSIDSGIGRLVDADMNEASTRLKALQTQQQLATQSLSIANTESQNIMLLFR